MAGAVLGLGTEAVWATCRGNEVAGRCFPLLCAELGRLEAALDSTSASVSTTLQAS